MCVLQLGGRYDAQEIRRAVEYLLKNADDKKHFWYGQYYAAHALHQVGGKDWEQWYERIKGRLLPKQQANGCWSSGSLGSDDGAGPVYQTAIAVIILSTPLGYLPIFQS